MDNHPDRVREFKSFFGKYGLGQEMAVEAGKPYQAAAIGQAMMYGTSALHSTGVIEAASNQNADAPL